jgi:hypothetical protein
MPLLDWVEAGGTTPPVRIDWRGARYLAPGVQQDCIRVEGRRQCTPHH